MDVGVGGDLRQMGDHDDLMGARQAGQPATDLHGGTPSHSGVDLVEHHGRALGGRRQHHLQGQHHPRQLAARCALVQRQQVRAPVGGEAELHRVHAVAAGVHRLPRRQDQRGAVISAGGQRCDRDAELRAGHRQPGQLFGHRFGQPFGGLDPHLGQALRRCGHLALQGLDPAGQLGQGVLGHVELGEPIA